jgi:hypothetical protein
MDQNTQDKLRTVLESFEAEGNWAYSGLLIEALAACGGIEPVASADAIREEIGHR